MIPKVHLNTASEEVIKAALKYLQEKAFLKITDMSKAVAKIASANRESWKSFDEIPKLKCGITQAKVAALKEVFYLEPVTKIELPPLPKLISIKHSSRNEIFERLNYFCIYKIDGFDEINADNAADVIFTTSKSKWKSLNPIASLECGITQKQVKTLKSVFKL